MKRMTLEEFTRLGFVFSGAEGDETPLEGSAFVGENGALAPDWMTNSFPEGDAHRTNPTLANITTVQGLAKQVVSAESQIGKLSGGHDFTFLPNENSTPEEIKAHHMKCGMPEEVAGYKLNEIKLPEGMERDTDYETKAGETFHRIGITNKQAGELAQFDLAIRADNAAAAKVQEDIDNREADVELRKIFGAGYEREMLDAANAAHAFGDKIDPKETQLLIDGLKHDPFSAQLLAAAAKLMKETPQGELPGQTDGTMTPNDADIEIAKLQNDPYYMSEQPEGKPKNKILHESIIEKITTLTEMKFKG